MLGIILVVILMLMLFGAMPMGRSYNASWGYGPAGGLGFLLVIIIVLVFLGRI